MAKISIDDLELNEELDAEAMSQILGGKPGERLGPGIGTQLLRPIEASDTLIPRFYDPTWRFDGSL